MNFTYKAYETMLHKLVDAGYFFSDYRNWTEYDKTVILRHDVDMSLFYAVHMAELEKEVLGKANNSIYFLLLSTNFYNIFSKESRQYISQILKNGGRIGLHFDETQYSISNKEELGELILNEISLMENQIESSIDVVSMHRPSKEFLSHQIVIKNKMNAYGKEFFEEMKYVSDSRRCWREDVDQIISDGQYNRLHILTHPVWYNQVEKKGIKQALYTEITDSFKRKYRDYKENISDFESIISQREFNELIKYIPDR